MDIREATRYGAPVDDLQAAVAPLRAHAAAGGVLLTPFERLDPVDGAAAVVGAELLLWAVEGDTLGVLGRRGRAVATAYARLLHRAAGRPLPVGHNLGPAPSLPLPPHLLREVRQVAAQAGWLLPDADVAEVLERAAEDLGGGDGGGPVAVLADALLASLPLVE